MLEIFFGLVVLGFLLDHGLTNIAKSNEMKANAIIILAKELRDASKSIGGRR